MDATTTYFDASSAVQGVAAGSESIAFAEVELQAQQNTFFSNVGNEISDGLAPVFTSESLFGLGLSAFKSIADIFAGNEEGASFDRQADNEDAAARIEALKGRQEALEILKKENDLLEQNTVNAFASGITGQGSVKAAQDAISKKAEFETGVTRDNAKLVAAGKTQTAESLRVDADAARTGGTVAAAGNVAGFFFSNARRG